jgi:hypothetical protein
LRRPADLAVLRLDREIVDDGVTLRHLRIGAKRLEQLQDNLAAMELTLTEHELRLLDEVSALALEYPGWVLPFQGADRLGPADRWERLREASSPR